MIQNLTAIGFAIIGLAIVIGIGIVILTTLSVNVASCPPLYPTWNGTAQMCQNASVFQVGPSQATTQLNTLTGYLGTSSGGLASWVPIIIVLMVGMLFLGYFMSAKGRKS